MTPKRDRIYDFAAMHERALRAIFALKRNLREISILMGTDVTIPLHKRKPVQPTQQNIKMAAEAIGVSVGWLTTGIPETTNDFLAIGHAPTINNINGSAVVTDNQHCTIVVDHTAGGA